MSEKTLVLEIQELYQVIPECKLLEGKNFSGIKELLINLVEAIEASGDWEFIQYINNKPSLFVIRKVQTGSRFESTKFREFESMYKDVKNMHAGMAGYQATSYEPEPYQDIAGPAVGVLKNDEMKETEKQIEKNLNDTYVPSVKLPWEN